MNTNYEVVYSFKSNTYLDEEIKKDIFISKYIRLIKTQELMVLIIDENGI